MGVGLNVTQYIEAILQREGGFVDHPNDKGGPTNWGITEQVARSFGYFGDMRQLPRETAFNIYLERYWAQPKFDKVNDLSQSIAEEMLDTGVNMGTGTAAKFLQRALNVLNVQEQHYPDIEVDGSIGRMTLFALSSFLNRRGREGEAVLLKMLNSQQSVRYMEIAERDKRQETFQFGWQRHRVS